MKKLFFMMACLFAVVAMTSCKSNTPKDVATSYVQAMQDKDAEDLVALIGDSKGNALSSEEAEQTKALLENKLLLLDENNTIKSFEFVEEDIDEENGKATVTFEVVYGNDKKESKKVNLRKGEDDQWRIKD